MPDVRNKIGVGIITCNREDFLKKCLGSIPEYIDELVIVNDGKVLSKEIEIRGSLIQNTIGRQVGKCKNLAMSHLLNRGCDYIFTLEDDIMIKDPETFNHYINASLETGLEHFNFGFSQKENLTPDLKPVYRKIVKYKNCSIVLTPNVLGALTFYTRQALQTIGLHHFKFNKGHGDHPELTYRAWKHGFTTPFWWFADIYGSWDMIENLSNMGSDSVVRNQEDMMKNFYEACNVFKELHGVHMLEVPQVSEQEVITFLKNKVKNES
jgi:glycosyltransferase involved in cell wall biosynthesis